MSIVWDAAKSEMLEGSNYIPRTGKIVQPAAKPLKQNRAARSPLFIQTMQQHPPCRAFPGGYEKNFRGE
jgi:hypothetical protein